MPWVFGKNDGQVLLPDDWSHNWKLDWEEKMCFLDLVYGGFLSSHIENLETELEGFHEMLLKDFQAGWSAVAFAAQGEGAPAGPFAAPTTARAHSGAPLGLYLLSGNRLRASFKVVLNMTPSASRLELGLHQAQLGLGVFFCDPNLEVCVRGKPDFFYQAPTRFQEWKNALFYLFESPDTRVQRAPTSALPNERDQGE